MTFTMNSATRCLGGNHWTINLTAGGATRLWEVQASDLQLDFPLEKVALFLVILGLLVPVFAK